MVFGYSAIRGTSYRSWFLVYQRVLPQACLIQHPWHLQGRKLIIPRLPQARLPHHPRLCHATVRLEHGKDLCGIDSYPVPVSRKHVERKERWDLLTKPTKKPKPKKNEDLDLERWDLLNSDIQEWLQEFRENLVDDRVPERRDASSSHESSLEPAPARSADLGQHSVETHFPKDRNLRDLPEDQNHKGSV